MDPLVLGLLLAFLVVLGGGAWYYLSTEKDDEEEEIIDEDESGPVPSRGPVACEGEIVNGIYEKASADAECTFKSCTTGYVNYNETCAKVGDMCGEGSYITEEGKCIREGGSCGDESSIKQIINGKCEFVSCNSQYGEFKRGECEDVSTYCESKVDKKTNFTTEKNDQNIDKCRLESCKDGNILIDGECKNMNSELCTKEQLGTTYVENGNYTYENSDCKFNDCKTGFKKTSDNKCQALQQYCLDLGSKNGSNVQDSIFEVPKYDENCEIIGCNKPGYIYSIEEKKCVAQYSDCIPQKFKKGTDENKRYEYNNEGKCIETENQCLIGFKFNAQGECVKEDECMELGGICYTDVNNYCNSKENTRNTEYTQQKDDECTFSKCEDGYSEAHDEVTKDMGEWGIVKNYVKITPSVCVKKGESCEYTGNKELNNFKPKYLRSRDKKLYCGVSKQCEDGYFKNNNKCVTTEELRDDIQSQQQLSERKSGFKDRIIDPYAEGITSMSTSAYCVDASNEQSQNMFIGTQGMCKSGEIMIGSTEKGGHNCKSEERKVHCVIKEEYGTSWAWKGDEDGTDVSYVERTPHKLTKSNKKFYNYETSCHKEKDPKELTDTDRNDENLGDGKYKYTQGLCEEGDIMIATESCRYGKKGKCLRGDKYNLKTGGGWVWTTDGKLTLPTKYSSATKEIVDPSNYNYKYYHYRMPCVEKGSILKGQIGQKSGCKDGDYMIGYMDKDVKNQLPDTVEAKNICGRSKAQAFCMRGAEKGVTWDFK